MKFYQSPLFYLGILALLLSPLTGYGFVVMIMSGILFLLLDLGIRKLSVPLWAKLLIQGLVVVNWLFWGIRAVGALVMWMDSALR